jgi:hypothetical protein
MDQIDKYVGHVLYSLRVELVSSWHKGGLVGCGGETNPLKENFGSIFSSFCSPFTNDFLDHCKLILINKLRL